MSKYIVIKMEGDIDYIERVIYGADIPYTEIDTDQSIDERAKKIISESGIKLFDQILSPDGKGSQSQRLLNALKQIATEQDLISKVREKDKEEEKFTCTHCGSNKTYKTEAYHCNMCAMTTEI